MRPDGDRGQRSRPRGQAGGGCPAHVPAARARPRRRHAETRVLVLVADLDVQVLTEDGELLRALTLDPSRDYQPLNRSL